MADALSFIDTLYQGTLAERDTDLKRCVSFPLESEWGFGERWFVVLDYKLRACFDLRMFDPRTAERVLLFAVLKGFILKEGDRIKLTFHFKDLPFKAAILAAKDALPKDLLAEINALSKVVVCVKCNAETSGFQKPDGGILAFFCSSCGGQEMKFKEALKSLNDILDFLTDDPRGNIVKDDNVSLPE